LKVFTQSSDFVFSGKKQPGRGQIKNATAALRYVVYNNNYDIAEICTTAKDKIKIRAVVVGRPHGNGGEWPVNNRARPV
jgi:hypothetical protein